MREGLDPSGLGYIAGNTGGGAGHSIPPTGTNPNDVTRITQHHDGRTEIEYRHQKDRREREEWRKNNPEAAAAANEKYWSDMRDTFGFLGETVGSFCPGVGEGLDGAVIADPDSSWWEKGLAGASLGLSVATAGTSPNIGGVLRAGDKVAEGLSDGAKAADDCPTRGPNGGKRTDADQRRIEEQKEKRRIRREQQSREKNGQNQSGEGHRNHENANRGPQGNRPKGESGRNRERNVGIDEEHSRVPKGKGGGQGSH